MSTYRGQVCDGCGAQVAGTIGGKCDECRQEDQALAALRSAADRMEALIEQRRARARRASWA